MSWMTTVKKRKHTKNAKNNLKSTYYQNVI